MEYPGTAAELCELDFSTPWQLLVATVLVGPNDRRTGQLGHARPCSPGSPIPRTWPWPTRPRSRLSSARPAFSGSRPGTSSPWPAPCASVSSARCRPPGRSRHPARRGPQDRQCRPQRRLSACRAYRSTLTWAASAGSWRSPSNTDPVKVEADCLRPVAQPGMGPLSLRMILHGRRVCIARRPRCCRVRAGRLLPVGRTAATAGRRQARPPHLSVRRRSALAGEQPFQPSAGRAEGAFDLQQAVAVAFLVTGDSSDSRRVTLRVSSPRVLDTAVSSAPTLMLPQLGRPAALLPGGPAQPICLRRLRRASLASGPWDSRSHRSTGAR